jgi:K+:H+ antiporter subunit KhtU
MGASLVAIGGALVAASILGRLGRRIGLPTIPLFMLAGLAFGPHTAGLDLVHDPHALELLATLGLVLLLFSLGLEFSVDELVGGGRRLLAAGAVFVAGNLGAGLVFGFALGWGTREALVIAGAIAVSSSAIATKLLIEFRRLENDETRAILGVIVVEDLFLALYLALLQPVLHHDQGALDAVFSIGKAFAFLVGLAVLARHGVRLVSRVVDTEDNELLIAGCIGFAVLAAGVAEELGVSDAIGAFMIGLVLAGTRNRTRITQLVHPLRDTFAALFFFAFGVSVDPGDITSVIGPVAIAAAMTAGVTIIAAAIVARVYGFAPPASANMAFTMLARGEFSLILASLAATAGLDARIGPFVAGYVLVLAIVSPLLAANPSRFSRAFAIVTRSRPRASAAGARRNSGPTSGSAAAKTHAVLADSPDQRCPARRVDCSALPNGGRERGVA